MLCINDVALRANDVVPLGQIAVSHRRNTPTRHSLRKVLLVILSYGAVGVPRDIVKYRGVLAPKNRRLSIVYPQFALKGNVAWSETDILSRLARTSFCGANIVADCIPHYISPFSHTTSMKTRTKRDINPTDRMIQGNKDEADGMLSLWGMKPRKHLKTKRLKK